MNFKVTFEVNESKLVYFSKLFCVKYSDDLEKKSSALLIKVRKNWFKNKKYFLSQTSGLFPNSIERHIKVFLFPESFQLGASNTADGVILFGQRLRSKNFSSAIIAHEIMHVLLSEVKLERPHIIDEIICLSLEEKFYLAENKTLEKIWSPNELDKFHSKAFELALKHKENIDFKNNTVSIINYLKKEIPKRNIIKKPKGLVSVLRRQKSLKSSARPTKAAEDI